MTQRLAHGEVLLQSMSINCNQVFHFPDQKLDRKVPSIWVAINHGQRQCRSPQLSPTTGAAHPAGASNLVKRDHLNPGEIHRCMGGGIAIR